MVIGNPPYKNKAAGLGGWIEKGTTGRAAPMDYWSPPASWGVGAHTHHLKNLYVYFWRWATWKVFGTGLYESTGLPSKDENGIVCFITAAGFINGPGFGKMREDLRRTCSEIWVIDCSPEGHQPEVSTRIFQGVQQPVCIVLAARSLEKDRGTPSQVSYLALPEGERRTKFEALNSLTLLDEAWHPCSLEWRDSFLPSFGTFWKTFPALSEVFDWSGSGVTPHRTWPISPDVHSLENRWTAIQNESDPEEKNILFHADRDRTVSKLVKVDLGSYMTRPISVADDKDSIVSPVRYAFRSFDRQWIPPDNRLLSMQRPLLWSAYSAKQIFLTALDRTSPWAGPAITLTSAIPDLDHYNGRGGRVYPLWSDAAAKQSNIKPALLAHLAKLYGREVSAEDMMAYIAAVMANPAFTARFAPDLVQPGLRVPLTAEVKLFDKAVALGREVIWLHCYGERFADPKADRPKQPPRLPKDIAPRIPKDGAIPLAPEPLPETMDYDPAKRRLTIGEGYIDNVTQQMWDYEVSGKKVLRQWFSYRRRDRTRPTIGDKRPPSPLEKIQPESWLAEYTTDLLDLLNVLGRVIALEPAQADLLERICGGPLVGEDALLAAGVLTPAASEMEPEPVAAET